MHEHDTSTSTSRRPLDHGDQRRDTGSQRIVLSRFAENDARADINRRPSPTTASGSLNLMSSPGSGKTTVLAATLDELAGDIAVGVIEGDIATDWIDAAQLRGAAPRSRC